MNNVKIVSLALISAIVLFSCKKNETTTSETNLNSEKEIALSETKISNEIISETYLYVTASSGLSLREYANLSSEKLAVMPYGTRVKVINTEKNPTMKVGGIKGGMDKVEFNHKNGFAFNGFLSKYFPPERGANSKFYAEELIELFPEVKFTETVGGTVSKPSKTETLLLPNTQWHEAYYMAQQLFKIPKDFTFPSLTGKDSQIITEKNLRKDSWTNELQISRKDNELSKIEYVYKNKGFSKTVTIVKEGDVMKISSSEKVE